MILATDHGKRMGWCAVAPGVVPVSGEIDLVPPSEIIRGNEGRAYSKLRETILDLIGVHAPRELWIEEAVPTQKRSLDTLRFLMGLNAIAEEAAYSRGVPVFTAGVSTIRLQVLGNGAAGKNGVLWWVRDNDWTVAGDNAADAICLAQYAACCERPLWRLTPGPNAQKARDQIFARDEAALRGQARPA